MEFNIDQFSPQKAELTTLSNTYKALVINGVEDKQGYKAVDEARKDLKRKRVEISKTGKSLREEALAFQKKIITVEKELIALIEPVELELEQKQAEIDEAIQLEKRRETLPYRHAQLNEIGVVMSDDFVLAMNDQEFLAYLTNKRAEILAEKERKLKEAEEKLANEQRVLEEAKRIEEAKSIERQKAEEMAKAAAIQAEFDKQNAIEAEKQRAEKEKADLIAAQEKKEKERVAAIEAEEKRLLDEKTKLEAKKKYQTWLADNNYSESEDFFLQRNATKIVLYKKVSEFNL